MNNMKHGFSTLNRWLGKKNKSDKATPNGKLSKSSTNLNSLSVSSTNINETSQLEYNRITPLPAATSNAPFEQTFRITVLLPKDQLYVARLGARVPLSKLLELVCENKLLDASKYEFRNPVDSSQVYSCELTIGAVGLSEIRLCNKSETYGNFNADEIIKLHRTAIIRDSLSSSEFSSRYSKHTTKTTSPYSSSNSLNSMDSTGMNCVRTPVSPPATLTTATTPSIISAPPRKKRAAPRPPSQTAIPEKTVLVTNGETNAKDTNSNIDKLEVLEGSLSHKNHFVSTPNLSTSPEVTTLDSNGHISSLNIDSKRESSLNGYTNLEIEMEQSQVKQKNARNLVGGSVQNLNSAETVQQPIEFPEPSPRKRMIQIKKKTTAPAPPPRGSSYADSDTLSIHSMSSSTPGTPISPLMPISPEPLSANTNLEVHIDPNSNNQQMANEIPTPMFETTSPVPKPLPRITTNAPQNDKDTFMESKVSSPTPTNVSKIILNRTPTPEPRSLSAEPQDSDSYLGVHIGALKNTSDLEHDQESKQMDSGNYLNAHIAAFKNASILEHEDDALSKQADSGIGEPIPSPIPDSLPSESSVNDGKSAFESSSDDDDIIKVYNFKLGKTVVKTQIEPQTLEDFVVLAAEEQVESGDNTSAPATQEATPNFSDSSSWNFTIPISPPPNFADGRFADGFVTEKTPDTPITPKIKERPTLDFKSISQAERSFTEAVGNSNQKPTNTHEMEFKKESLALPSPTTPLNEIVEELSEIIHNKRLDTLIKKPEDEPKIQAAKPTTLSNFSITTITQQIQEKENEDPSEVSELNTENSAPNFNFQQVTNQNQIPSEKLAHIAGQQNVTNLDSPSAQVTYEKVDQSGFGSSRRRSSGELSIGESPSLQSPEVIKTILNSRKNSSASSSDAETKVAEELKRQDEKDVEQKVNIPSLAEPPKNIVNAQKQVDTNITMPQFSVTSNFESTESKEVQKMNLVKTAETPKNKINAKKEEESRVSSPDHTKSKEVPKVYRYSGPPSINFSTWSERPKVQVSIKNEGDYIFGGKNADSQSAAVTTAAIEINTRSHNRNNRVSMPAAAFWAERENAPPPVAPKPITLTERMGIPEKEYHIPMNVKPLRDVTIENVDLNTTTNNITQQRPSPNGQWKSTSITTVLLNGNSELENNKSETVTKPAFTSTLPRSNASRFSMPAVNNVGSVLLRSTSITQLEANKPKLTQSEAVAAPFGQNTLRKTGLKEKILANDTLPKEKAETESNIREQIPKSQRSSLKSSTTTSNGFVGMTNVTTTSETKKVHQKPVQSAKLELKLQNSSSVYLNRTSFNPATNITTTTKTQSDVKSTSLVPPPPPTPPKGVTLSTPNSSPATTPSSTDPRDQLLMAIRNFKRDNLNRI
ncbi:mucin-5AC [Bactrocera dorsalis]|uniref:Mucin-5AC n=1 Tax=Bactrocera dorsalis TaxID=27457 RepID=A0ABM3JTS9_BACDO|nr:mucin-5AC [Bactrocera dorsalis]XP_011209392.2 mucin-5AC [Bactrocera dorsalis]XP_019847330.2 mucin-5AC [Bactrocera dorsalis]XP_019847331.2 mucin-5AC [Bactrocera dorsalis]XP_029407878.2 mucin-5AC [Bactrocera dorsalis]XP_049312577.1 mucin-5AC [Bactrocera dorsalis]XP_049312578.1 mucin-5AC [Bactrocera dorsalis]XP_049312579.1 mucin-5AC [Bactrocera dorsalis]XP_049312580.1 mucin-5AC [Bactrocera dorsalis]XP_049312581.1 mucin-5AC [Bactrocera dorsalis]XP_049312582.1 mucin-5AC [Bactrocera dorsalis